MVDKFIIKRPIVSEKATSLGALNQYVFLVADNATSPEIKKALELIYKVKITRVNIVNVKPKKRRLGRSIGVKSGYKKAIVRLAEGQKLDITPGKN